MTTPTGHTLTVTLPDGVLAVGRVVYPQPKPTGRAPRHFSASVGTSMASRQDATDKRIDTLQQALATSERRQGERHDSLVTGLVIGGAVVLVVVAVVLGLGQ